MEFYVAGATMDSLHAFMSRFAPQGYTLQRSEGGWNGQREVSFVVTLFAPWDTAAHFAENIGPPGVLMPAIRDSILGRAADIAENMALEFQQEAVAYAVVPCHFALTTPRASYRRNG
jgi:hypothetical protein